MKKFTDMIREAAETKAGSQALTDFVGLLNDFIEQDVEEGCCESAEDHPLNALIYIANTLPEDCLGNITHGLMDFYGYDTDETAGEDDEDDVIEESIDPEEFYLITEGSVASDMIARARHAVEKSKEAHGKKGIQALIAHGYSAEGARALLKQAKKNLKKGRKKALMTRKKHRKIIAKLRDKISKIRSKMVGKD